VELAAGVDREDLPYLVEFVGNRFTAALVETTDCFDQGEFPRLEKLAYATSVPRDTRIKVT